MAATLPVQYINPFFTATRRVCAETLKLPVTAGKPRLLKETERLWKLFQISAAVRLDQAVRGVIGLSFSEPVALALAGGLAQEVFPSLNADARDALAEAANLIVGSAKREIPDGLVTVSTPQVIPTHQLELPPGLPTIVLPFEMPCGRFVMQLSMLPTAATLPAAA